MKTVYTSLRIIHCYRNTVSGKKNSFFLRMQLGLGIRNNDGNQNSFWYIIRVNKKMCFI